MDDLLKTIDLCLSKDGPVALVIKEYLRPVDGVGEVIFPPTYPMPTYRGRVHTVRDGEYRVSVELPPFSSGLGSAEKKKEDEEKSAAGYNIDEFSDGSNVCEIDSPQSQANRLEPLFKTIKDGALVPQIAIKVGNESINILDAGHRAADAVVRMSSMVAEFHEAFREVQRGSHLALAALAPTSLLFGVWDSRGTQVKLPRLIKAEIRATNVQTCTRSAQFVPAIDYVRAGAVDEALDAGSGDKNPLGAEGLKHVPVPRTAGGVKVQGEIKRVVRLNLVALRGLRALNENGTANELKTQQLQHYIIGLALIAATHPLPLDLREGCLLCGAGDARNGTWLVKTDGTDVPATLQTSVVEDYAETAAEKFFGERYKSKDRPDAKFETGVANKFLGMSQDSRKKLARNGPITDDSIRRFEESGKDALQQISAAIRASQKSLPKPKGRNAGPVVNSESLVPVSEKLSELVDNDLLDESVKELLNKLRETIQSDNNTKDTLSRLAKEIKAFTVKSKSPAVSIESEKVAEPE